MCRHAAYIGSSLSLGDFILNHDHNLIDQAIHPQEMRVGRVNADGFGIGWYLDDDKPASYKDTRPIWSDPNLAAIGASLHRQQWIAMVRGASPGLGISIDNTHPFSDDRWLFTLNGIIADFAETLRPTIVKRLSDTIAADTRGHTDAEFLFALLRQFSLENKTASTRTLLTSLISYLEDIAGDVEIALNILLCEPGVVYATRYAINLPNPTLYYSEKFAGGCAVSSEPIGEREHWAMVPEQALLMVGQTGGASIEIIGQP